MTIARKLLCSIALVAWLAACGSGEDAAPAASESQAAPAAEATTPAATATEATPAPDDTAAEAEASAELVETGTFTLTMYRASFVGSAGVSSGVLQYGGTSRKFNMTGLGIGGFGISKAVANGTVYNLKNVDDFTGTYIQARSGVTLGDDALDRKTWMANDRGVKLNMSWESKGLQLNLGADGMVVTWDD